MFGALKKLFGGKEEYERFRSWNEVRTGLSGAMQSAHFYDYFELLVKEGFNSGSPGKLTDREKKELASRAQNARNGNPKAFSDMAEIGDKTALKRIADWLSNTYRTDIVSMPPNKLFPDFSVKADLITVANLNKLYRYNRSLCGDQSDAAVWDMSQIKVKTWQDCTVFIKGSALLIAQSTMQLETAFCIPGLVNSFNMLPSLGMIHIPFIDTVLLNSSAARNLQPFPSGLGYGTKPDFNYMKQVLGQYGWQIEELSWPDNVLR